jgi:hypothetical protein
MLPRKRTWNCTTRTVVFMSLFVIVSINHPFTGPVHVDSELLRDVLAEFGHR